MAATVVTPIEQQINGVENMICIASNSTGDGRFTINVTFDIGTNLDIAQVQVQNRVAIAQPRLPVDVRNIGVKVDKSSPDLMMVVHLYSPDNLAIRCSSPTTPPLRSPTPSPASMGSVR